MAINVFCDKAVIGITSIVKQGIRNDDRLFMVIRDIHETQYKLLDVESGLYGYTCDTLDKLIDSCQLELVTNNVELRLTEIR